MNRITGATDNTGHYNLNSIAYDKNGNITALNRQGAIVENPVLSNSSHFNVMDNLTYTYDNGNKLTKVADTGNTTFGFKDGANTSIEYQYDGNGNMISDANKGITAIVYNHLNLPTEVKFNNSNTQKINYIYSANGEKLKKIANDNGTVTTTDYASNYIYENENLKQFSHSEGYVEVDGNGGFDYVYSYLDHLGTVRLTYSDFNGNGIIEPNTEILQERNTYPFGLEHKGYNNIQNGTESNYQTYLGQEMNKELGLNWLTFRYRNYMPELGRFFGVDPVSEEYFSISTYQFAHNNPSSKIELEGLEGELPTGEKQPVNHEPVKVKNTPSLGLVGGGLVNTKVVQETTKEIVKEAAKKPNALKSILNIGGKIIGAVAIGLSDYMSPNFGTENEIQPAPLKIGIDELFQVDDKTIKTEGESDSPIQRIDNMIIDLIVSSTPGRKTKGKSSIYEREGGIDEANKVFDSFNPENVEDIEGGRVGTLTDGSTINVRLESTDGRPTVEIIHTNKKRTKFRFNEPE